MPAGLSVDATAVQSAQTGLEVQSQRVAALARTLNYNGSTEPEVLLNSAQECIHNIGAGIFKLGAYLLLLKEACEHGKFLPSLERLGVGEDAAQRYMAVTRRFANSVSTRNLADAGISKLVELLPLEDGQVADLLELGQTGELALDDVARMSVKELRAAVRKERGLVERKSREVQRLHEVTEELHEEARRIKRQKPDEALAALKKDATEAGAGAEGAIVGLLRQALIALNGHDPEPGAQKVFMAGLVGQVQAQVTALRVEFDLPDISTAESAQREDDLRAVREGMAAVRAGKAAQAAAGSAQ
jgi:hypothetical protein